MSQPKFSSIKSEARDANLWKAELTPEKLKSLEKANQVEARSDEARWKLQKDRIVTWGSVAILLAAFAACLITIAWRSDPRETQPHWAILFSMVAGVFSYLAGKAAR